MNAAISNLHSHGVLRLRAFIEWLFPSPRASGEVYRVLKRGGEFWIVDFGKPHNALASVISLVMRNAERTKDLIHGLLPEQLKRANFQDIAEVEKFMTIFGTIVLYRARKAGL